MYDCNADLCNPNRKADYIYMQEYTLYALLVKRSRHVVPAKLCIKCHDERSGLPRTPLTLCLLPHES